MPSAQWQCQLLYLLFLVNMESTHAVRNSTRQKGPPSKIEKKSFNDFFSFKLRF